MNRTNKEQILFLVALLILGSLGYLRYGDQAKRKSVPPSKSYAWLPLEACPEIQFLSDAEARYTLAGRNVFAPPRDWFPLEQLLLEMPPGVELDPVWPYPIPCLAEEHFGLYRKPFEEPTFEESALSKEEAPLEEDFEGEEILPGEVAGVRGQPGGVRIDLDEIEEEDPDVALMARFDWIRLNDRRDRIFGQILNDDKFKLLDALNEAPIELRRYNPRNEKWAEIFPYERSRINEFGFAQTVSNVYQLKKRTIVPNAANIDAMHELARWCLERRDEDPAAVAYAVEMVTSAVEQDPLLGASYLLLADIHELAFNLEELVAILQAAMQRGILEPGIYERYGRFLDRYGLLDRAERALRQGLRIRPDDAACLLALGDLQMKQGLYEQALESYEESLRSPSLSGQMKAGALVRKGRSLLALNRLSDASQEAGRATHLDNQNIEAILLRGCAAMAGGDLQGMLNTMQRALEIAPDNGRLLADLGVGLLRRGELDEAFKLLEEAASLDPLYSSGPLRTMGFAYELTGETERASDSYMSAVRVEPDDAFALYLLGRFQRRQGDPEEALRTLKRALRLNGRIAAILGELGHACLDAGLYEDGAFFFSEYAKRGGEDLEALCLQGITHLRLGLIEEAKTFFTRAVDLDSKAPAALNGLAVAHYMAGDAIESIDTFARVLRLFPEESVDPHFRYAFDTRAAIETHLRKSQWIDRFQRKEIKNGWEVVQRYGPRVDLMQNAVHFRGMQRQGLGGEMTLLRRSLSGKEIRSLEAELQAQEGHQAVMGVFLGYYPHHGAQKKKAQAEVRLGVDQDGRIVYSVIDLGSLQRDWEVIEGYRIPIGESVKLGFEIQDYEQGDLRLLVNDTPVINGLRIKRLKKITRPVDLGIFGVGTGGRTHAFKTGYVRIVKTEAE